MTTIDAKQYQSGATCYGPHCKPPLNLMLPVSPYDTKEVRWPRAIRVKGNLPLYNVLAMKNDGPWQKGGNWCDRRIDVRCRFILLSLHSQREKTRVIMYFMCLKYCYKNRFDHLVAEILQWVATLLIAFWIWTEIERVRQTSKALSSYCWGPVFSQQPISSLEVVVVVLKRRAAFCVVMHV